MTTTNRWLTVLLVVASTALWGTAAHAATVTRSFLFSSTQGPIQFSNAVGSFSYDDSVVPNPSNGFVLGPNLFSQVSIAFGSFSFNASTANSGFLRFDLSTGELLEVLIGNDCNAPPLMLGQCQVQGDEADFWVRVGKVGQSQNDFKYGAGFAPGMPPDIFTTELNRLLPLAVPEPAPWALLLAAAGWLWCRGGASRRSKVLR